MTIKQNFNTEDQFNQNYTDAIQCPYTLAKNAMHDNKIINKYRGFHSFIEMENFIKSISQMKQKVYFEVLTDDYTKPFFDIDKSNLSFEEYDRFIDEFIGAFNIFFKTNILKPELLIYYRDDNKNKNIITSSHIIVTKYNTSRNNIKLFLTYFNKYLHPLEKGDTKNSMVLKERRVPLIDDKIYTKNRLFNLPYNTKIKYIDGTFNDKNFIDYKNQSKSIKDYLASYTLNTIKLNIPKYHGVVTILQKLEKIITKNDNKLLKVYFNKLKQNASLTQSEPIEKQKLYFNSINSSLDFLADNLPNDFFKNSSDWRMITNIFKKYGITQDQFDKWNKTSTEKTNNKWTKDANTSFYNSIDVLKVRSGKPIFKSIISSYLNVELIFDYDDTLIKWLETQTNINCDWVKENEITAEKIIIKNYTFGKSISKDGVCGENPAEDFQYEYNTITGFLKNNKNEIIGNYHYDITLKTNYELNKNETNIINLNYIDEIDNYLTEFNNKEKDIFCVKAKWGTGKTHKIIRNVIENSKTQNNRVIMLSENNALNLKFSKEFNFQTHINNSNLDQSKNIVCSTESIQKIKFNEEDILILDEYETLINHFESDTFAKQAFNKFMLFKNAIKMVKKILILDADISRERIKLIENIRQEQIDIININQNNFSEYSFFVYETKDAFISSIKKNIKNDKKILIASSSKTLNDNIYIDFKNKMNSKKINYKIILKIDSEGAFIFKFGSEDKIDKHNTLHNLEEVIIDNNIDILLFSPTIKTGVSINTEYFNICYGYAHSKSICSREFIQMLFRSRNLIDKEIHIGFNTSFRPIVPYIDKNKLENYIIAPILIFQIEKKKDDEDKYKPSKNLQELRDYMDYFVDRDYLNLKILNLKENYNSNKNFTQDILSRLLYNHKITIQYKGYDDDDDDEDDTEETKNEEIEDPFIEIEIPTHYKVRTQTLKWISMKKYNFFYKQYFIKGITDRYEPSEPVYKVINNKLFYNRYFTPELQNQYKLIKYIYSNKLNMNTSYLHQTINKLDQTEHYIGKAEIVLDVLKNINLDIKTLPITKTNKEFNTLLMNFNLNGFQNDILDYFNNYKIEHHHKINFNDKNYIKNIKKALHELLNEIGVSFKYVDEKNTSRDYDKIEFYFKDFNTEKKAYQGRLSGEHFRTNIIKKFKRGFKNIDGTIDLYKSNKNYYTTYQIKINKNIKYLSGRITDETNYKDLMDHILHLELKNYLYKKYRPYIIDISDYEEVLVKYNDDEDDV